MSPEPHTGLRLPLFPLPNLVHFPQTELRLHIFEPRYRQLIEDLAAEQADRRLIGMLLIHESAGEGGAAAVTTVYGAGTAGRLIDVDYLPDGRSNIRLWGDFRFRVEREVEGKPYRQGIVRPWLEPAVDSRSPEHTALAQELGRLADEVAVETGDRFPIDPKKLLDLRGKSLETLVNSLAADLDLPPLRKLQLLSRPLPERARELVSILGGRKTVLRKLRPFRHLVGDPDLN
jgi:Lon protease-like protein